MWRMQGHSRRLNNNINTQTLSSYNSGLKFFIGKKNLFFFSMASQTPFNFKLIFVLGALIVFICSCTFQESTKKEIDRQPSITMKSNLIIGKNSESDSLEIVLGEPVAIRSDSNYIFIADRSSSNVKVFDKKGKYIRSFGRRGRGPAEFHDISFMEITPSGDLMFLDRNNLRYTILTRQGEYVWSQTIRLNDQFYFKGVQFLDKVMIGMYISAKSTSLSKSSEVYDRPIFHVFSTDMKTKYSSFGEFNQLGIEDWFGWNTISIFVGSMDYDDQLNKLLFSPGIYTGSLYVYEKDKEDKWSLSSTFSGTPPHSDPYILYDTDTQYESAKKYPGVTKISFAGKSGRGKLNSMNAGVFYLPNRKQIVQFYAEWREGDVTLEDGNLLDLSMQLFDLEGNLIEQSYLTSMQIRSRTNQALVNWMDEDENFYMIDYSTGKPLVIRFTLDLP